MRHFSMTRLFLILIAFTANRQASAQESGTLGPAVLDSKTHWQATDPAQIKALNELAAKPAKVRIGLRLTPFKKVVTRAPTGKADTRYVPGEALRHTLRARLNETNHFFVGDWHVETVPVSWVKKTRHYSVKLNLYRRYGAFGQLEESVGQIELAGILEEQEGNVHVLVGAARQRLRDRLGNPYLDVVAGYEPGQDTSPSASAAAPENTGPTEPPASYSGELLRGRF